MTQDLLQLISNEMKGFSKGQKRIGAFILEHYDKAAFMTAAKLGETVGVSESTVVRFAAELGFEGYPQLQKSLQDIIRNRLTTVQRMEIIDEQLSGGVDTGTILCESAAVHVHPDASTRAREEESMIVRIDEQVHCKEDVLKLGEGCTVCL